MSDSEFLRRFETCTLDDFTHADHVRLACAYLDRHGPHGALDLLVTGLRRLAASKGHPEKFHYTMTRSWLELIASTRARHPEARTMDALLQACPALLDSRALGRYYSDEVLSSSTARVDWVPPDRRPLSAEL